ncbi:hypothetical protein ACWEN6_25260 [Sphaerisporangium sp. NPDC004334]
MFDGDLLGTGIFLFAAAWVLCIFVLVAVRMVKSVRQRRILKYTDPVRAMDLIGRVRQLKVRGREADAVLLVHEELAMPADKARSWVKSI